MSSREQIWTCCWRRIFGFIWLSCYSGKKVSSPSFLPHFLKFHVSLCFFSPSRFDEYARWLGSTGPHRLLLPALSWCGKQQRPPPPTQPWPDIAPPSPLSLHPRSAPTALWSLSAALVSLPPAESRCAGLPHNRWEQVYRQRALQHV